MNRRGFFGRIPSLFAAMLVGKIVVSQPVAPLVLDEDLDLIVFTLNELGPYKWAYLAGDLDTLGGLHNDINKAFRRIAAK
mgnify:CR=1 FL=1